MAGKLFSSLLAQGLLFLSMSLSRLLQSFKSPFPS
uniref:Uncharacterized protein n=1 Tax=Tetraselmis sp. GSL018 TaxID=582737 RepID=A0A061S1G1_9CHLO